MILVERSDGLEENLDTTSEQHGELEAECQDSCETHVSVTPPQQLRIRAQSASPESPSRRREVDVESLSSGRVFTRANTQ
jgi:hypothetical protein